MIYLNHAGTSWPKPPPVLDAVARAAEAPPSRWPTLFEEAHATIAAELGIDRADLLPTPGCTQALAVAIADIPWQPGMRALTSGMEHHALVRPLLKTGVELGVIPRGDNGPLDLHALERELARGDVQLVAMSMASNVTGELLPYERILELAHAHDALCLLDGAQVAGWTPLDLGALEVDLFCFAGHKGPQAPWGIGGLYVRPGVFLDTPAAVCDGESCRPGPGYCDTGSVNLPALVGLAAGLTWMRAASPLAQARELAGRFREGVRDLGARVLGRGPQMPTCSFTMEGRSPTELAARLADRGIVVRGGTQCAPQTHDTLGTGTRGTLRVSIGPTTSAQEIEETLRVLATL